MSALQGDIVLELQLIMLYITANFDRTFTRSVLKLYLLLSYFVVTTL